MPELSRNSNIELLRLVLMYFVILLHYNGMGGGIISIVENYPFSSFAVNLLETLCVLAVDCFMIVSGYFLYTNKKIKTGKILDLLLIVVFYHYVDYALRIIFTEEAFSLKTFVGNILPGNYFAIFYLVCYALSPFVAKLYREMTARQASAFTVLLAGIFLVIPTVLHFGEDLHIAKTFDFLSPVSTNGDNNGYTVVNFMVCLCIGMYLRKTEWSAKWYLLLSLYVLIALCTAFLLPKIPSVDAYCNIAVVVMAVCFFLLFKKIKIQSRALNFISKSTFSIFCIHTGVFFNSIVWKKIINYGNITDNALTTTLWSLVYPLEMFLLCLALSIVMRVTFGKIKDVVCGKMPTAGVFDE